MRKELASPELTDDQESITEIPRMLYSHFYKNKISEEVKTETNGEIRLWIELPVFPGGKTDQKVIAVFTEVDDDDAIETKFALMSWYPPTEEYMASYEFEIFSKPQSRGWSYGEGSRFVETLSYKMNNSVSNLPSADHSLVDYTAAALKQMRAFLKNPKIVCQEYIDHAERSPR